MSKQENKVSPIGTFIFPHLTAPNTHFGMPGTYEVGLRLSGEEAENFKEELQGEYDQHLADFIKANPKKKNLQKRPLSIKEVLDEEGNPTGEWDFKFKNAAAFTNKQGETVEIRPVLADSKGNKFDAKIRFGTGTVGRVSYQLHAYDNTAFGVSMKLRGAQIIKPVEMGSSVQFDQVEDGWVAEEETVGAEDNGGDF